MLVPQGAASGLAYVEFPHNLNMTILLHSVYGFLMYALRSGIMMFERAARPSRGKTGTILPLNPYVRLRL